jgi:hypothetical protein
MDSSPPPVRPSGFDIVFLVILLTLGCVGMATRDFPDKSSVQCFLVAALFGWRIWLMRPKRSSLFDTPQAVEKSGRSSSRQARRITAAGRLSKLAFDNPQARSD